MTERLEVLNLAGNRLTDSCSSYIVTILQKCKALYSLDVEQCSITSRTVQKMADALHEGWVLSHLSIGCKKHHALRMLLFLQGGIIRLTEALSSSSQELLRLDLSNCGLTAPEFSQICTKFSQICTNLCRINILDLNLGRNSINLEGCDAVGSILANPQCSLRSLTLDRCNLGLAGGNDQLEELRMAENTNLALEQTLHFGEDMQDVSTCTGHQHGNSAEARVKTAP
ncbi:hypothetical protein QYE76_049147 [Lolium multiflorum]|uniref:Uncharacterized protein n=1 Tax=Lolium multiflorum TaxID=4521 RepID=A0AAD8SMF2_LOLMU|nr:hypothetical protein QYE76_049147 [Lolium multiflorum]